MLRDMNEVIDFAKNKGKKKIAVVEAASQPVIEGLKLASDIAFPVLIGNRDKIEKLVKETKLGEFEIVHSDSPLDSAYKGCELVRENKADFIMKGKIETPQFLRTILDKERGLRSGKILSHISLIEIPQYYKMIFLSDAGMNIRPDLEMKIKILENCLSVMKNMGYENPKVAFLASIETIHTDMPETIEAAAISKLADRGYFKGAIVDGPLGFDIVASRKAAELKGVKSEVAGDADCWIVPDVASGNILAKALIYFAGAKVGGIVYGAKAPIILLSRSDTPEMKLYSIAFGVAALG